MDHLLPQVLHFFGGSYIEIYFNVFVLRFRSEHVSTVVKNDQSNSFFSALSYYLFAFVDHSTDLHYLLNNKLLHICDHIWCARTTVTKIKNTVSRINVVFIKIL